VDAAGLLRGRVLRFALAAVLPQAIPIAVAVPGLLRAPLLPEAIVACLYLDERSGEVADALNGCCPLCRNPSAAKC
jgi:hypothetical protein